MALLGMLAVQVCHKSKWLVTTPGAPKKNDSAAISAGGLPSSVSIGIPDAMRQRRLYLSLKQHTSFFSRKDKLLRWLRGRNRTHLLDFAQVSCDSCFAIVLNDAYAFRHIYKTGGTAVMAQAGRDEGGCRRAPAAALRAHATHASLSPPPLRRSRRPPSPVPPPPVREEEYGDRFLVATVRDPLDRFLSGWAECGKRGRAGATHEGAMAYDERVFAWLERARRHQYAAPRKWYACINHSLPQANYLLRGAARPREVQALRRARGPSYDGGRRWHPRLRIVGDMRDLPRLLGVAGFDYDAAVGAPNNATADRVKSSRWPKDRAALSNRTVDALCRFLALDYYLFDFEAPERCRGWLGRDREDIDRS